MYFFFFIFLVQVLAYSTILFGNETEAVAFAEKNEYGTKDIKTIAEKIAEIPLEGGAKRMVIITQGESKQITAKYSSSFLYVGVRVCYFRFTQFLYTVYSVLKAAHRWHTLLATSQPHGRAR